ncbi:ABC-three component system middle component 1 [Flavobacterium aestuarii]|uniref:ABC-three component system middle component 1 n=1 Tax=Flavobacterium aestuarii TaxID=3149227 RepID=UPI0032B4744D
MTFDQLVLYIIHQIEARFSIKSQGPIENEMIEIASENLQNKKLLRFFRPLETLEPSLKTLLIVGINSDNQLKDVLQWAALCKELLLDPETADIYLAIMWTGETQPSLEECLRIEASEDFCRKFVLRPNETKESFVERTFITKVDVPTPLDLGQDPLISAFSVLEQEFSWFNDDEKVKWREAFSSGTSSFDLFNTLINNKSESNEAS